MAADANATLTPPEGEMPPDNGTPGPLLKPHFEVISIASVEMPGGDWHRYVLASGPTQITGYHRGSPEAVLSYAQTCAEDFNLRNATGKSARALGTRKSR